MLTYYKILLSLAGIIFISVILSSCSPTKYLGSEEYLLNKNIITSTDKEVKISDMESFIRQRPNKNIGPIKLYVRIYNLVNPEKEAIREVKRAEKLKAINDKRRKELKPEKEARFSIPAWIRDIGEPPVVFDKFAVNKTSRQLSLYLKNKGYYHAQITDSVHTENKKNTVFYLVKPGKPYIINQIKYQIEDSIIQVFVEKDTVNRLIDIQDKLDVDILQAERARIATMLKSKGYYYFSKEYIYYKIDTISTTNFQTIITIGLKKMERKRKIGSSVKEFHKKYMINEINYFTNFEPKKVIQLQEKYHKILSDSIFESTHFYYDSTLIIRPSVLLQGQRIRRGFIYNPAAVDKTYKYLSSLSAYRLVNIEFYEPQELSFDSVLEMKNIKKLNCNINLTPATPQSITLELEGTSASGVWGMAGNVLYRQKNLFKGSENFQLKFKYEQEKNSNLEPIEGERYTTLEYGIQADLSFPIFLVPFSFKNFNAKYAPNTNVSIGYNFRRRIDYSNQVFNASIAYNWKSNPALSHYFYPIDFYSTKLMRMDSAFVYYVQEQKAFERYFDHIISATRYTFIYNNQIHANSKDYTFWRTNIETSGSIFTAYKKISNAPLTQVNDIFDNVVSQIFSHISNETARTNLESLVNQELIKKGESYYTFDNILYYQYWKFDTELRRKINLWAQNDLAFRLFAGIIYPYGNTLVAPIEKQYGVGGANSLRGWRANTVGPGTYNFLEDSETGLSDAFNMQLSDIKLEANIEYRFNILWMLNGAVFLDAGNIWSIRDTDTREGGLFQADKFYKQLAVNTGFGFRVDLSFFIFRLDVGIPLSDPKYTDKWYWNNNKFGFNNLAYNFGIGYPF